MNYWIIKGTEKRNEFKSTLCRGKRSTWVTARPPRVLAKKDRLFMWESSPGRRIVGLAEILNHDLGNENGHRFYSLRYVTDLVKSQPTIDELRDIRALKNAAFLKSGPAMGILPLSPAEAIALFGEVLRRNHELDGIWPDLPRQINMVDVDLLVCGREGSEKLGIHLRYERDRRLVERKKRFVLESCGKLACEACGFNFSEKYGDRGRNFCEVHHRTPISEFHGERITKLEELAIVCSNCHRMLHKRPWITTEKLQGILKS